MRIEVARPCASPTAWPSRAATSTCTGADRERALALRGALAAAEASLRAGERDAEALRAAALAAMRARGVEPEYVALVDPDDLSPVPRVDGDVLVAVAASVGTHPPHRQHDPRRQRTAGRLSPP